MRTVRNHTAAGSSGKRIFAKPLSAIAVGALLLNLLPVPSVTALDFPNRTIVVSTAVPSAVANHNFQLTYASTNAVGSIVFEYCENSPLEDQPCTAPPGLDADSANLTGQTGNTGFIIDGLSTTANKIVLTRAPVAAATVASTYDFSNITNPSTAAVTEFVRIATYGSIDGTGSVIDSGTVAFATVTPFNVETFVPPFLRLCVGITVAADCSSASGTTLDLGDFSTSQAKAGQSQFAVGTNSISGYNLFAMGTTMTSGNNFIPALSGATASQPGSSQFGLNLKANSNPSVGAEPSGAGTGAPTTGYDTANLFRFNPGDNIASSSLPTDFNVMTVSYIVNISSSQPAGVYSTTLSYLATADF